MCIFKSPVREKNRHGLSLSLSTTASNFRSLAVPFYPSTYPDLICSATAVYSVLLSHHVSRLLSPPRGIFALLSAQPPLYCFNFAGRRGGIGVSQATTHEGIQPESQEQGAQEQGVVGYVPRPRRQERVRRVPSQRALLPHGCAGLERQKGDEPVSTPKRKRTSEGREK